MVSWSPVAAFCSLAQEFFSFVSDLDDTSHTDENEGTEPERRSGSGLDSADFPNGSELQLRKRRLGTSETDSEEDDLRSLDEFLVETNYVMQQEEEFGSVRGKKEKNVTPHWWTL